MSSQIELTFKKYTQMQTINADIMFEVDAAVHQTLWDDMVFQLKAHILADDLPPETFTSGHRVRFEVPSSTWQMWKKRHAQRWYARRLVARWPVQYEPDPDFRGADATCTVNLERFRTYPEARLPRDRYGQSFRMHVINPVWSVDTEGTPDA